MVSAPEWPRGPPAGINPRTFILVWLWSSPLHQCLTGWLLLRRFILENHPAVCSPSTRRRGELEFPLTRAGVPFQTGERLNIHFSSVKILQIYKKKEKPGLHQPLQAIWCPVPDEGQGKHAVCCQQEVLLSHSHTRAFSRCYAGMQASSEACWRKSGALIHVSE